MPQHFTLDQARNLLPRVKENLQQALVLKREHEKAEQSLQTIVNRVQMMGGMVLNRQEMVGHRSRMDATSMRLREVVEEIHELGCQIKDLDVGLLDFPTFYRGNEVLLCWKLGEEDITFWHGLEEGFRGRKPIDDEFLENHRGDPVE